MDTHNDHSAQTVRGLRLDLEDQKLIKNNNNEDGGGDGDDHVGMSLTVATQSGGVEVKRKRGRPRKEGVVVPDYPAPAKRGRGRPKGSGKWQGLDASSLAHSDASSFTPRVVTIQEGENIVERISFFARRPSETMCILSCEGTVSSAELLQPASSDVVRRYEGLFQIASLNGSVSNDGTKQSHLNVQLSKPDGYILGGRVAGSLIAAGTSKLVIATYKQKPKRCAGESSKTKKDESAAAALSLQTYDGENEANSLDNVYRVSPLPVDDSTAYRPELNHDLSHPFDWDT